MTRVFPELKKREDVRRELLNYLYSVHDDDEERARWIAWLEKQGEQNPANWFQELEDKLANATPQQLAEWKEKYFKEEPAEWSEEDECNVINICAHLRSVLTNETVEKYRNWLEILRQKLSNVERNGKNWKPSEEQMEALRVAKAYPSSERREILETLYEDLEQLKAS